MSFALPLMHDPAFFCCLCQPSAIRCPTISGCAKEVRDLLNKQRMTEIGVSLRVPSV